MAFAVSDGALRAVQRPVDSRPAYSMTISVDGFAEDYAQIWRKQPAVRTVVDFLGRNIASIGLHAFERISDTDRRRVTDGQVGHLLRKPNPATTQYRLFDALVHDMCIYDVAYWLKMFGAVIRIPPWMVTPKGGSWLRPDKFRVEGTGGWVEYDVDQVAHFHGYNPTDSRLGSPPIESLRATLSEEFEASRTREQMLRNGARMSGYLKRPAGAPDWRTNGGAERFRQSWRSQYSGGGPEAGGTPILEDGMEFVPAAQTSQQLQYVESRKLTREEVAAAFFIPPPMVGLLDNATFSNIDTQHRMLYQDALGPWLEMIQQEIELQVLPDLDDTGRIYVEFNLAQKLAGSFEEQAKSIQSAVGRPWMTANEARGRQNLPALDGDADQLVTPLNVLTGGQASPNDSPGKTEPGQPPKAVRARVPQTYGVRAAEVLGRCLARQAAAVRSRLGAKTDGPVWDEPRWDAELAADLLRVTVLVAKAAATATLTAFGADPDSYDESRTFAALKAAAERDAAAINSTTKARLDAAGDQASGVVVEFGDADRVADLAASQVAAASGLGATSAAWQLAGDRAVKTWVTGRHTGHAALAGQTVGIQERFSSGLSWPGDGIKADECAGCDCGVEVSIP